jgi:hypothetical protein
MKTIRKWTMGVVAVAFSVGALADGAMAEGYIVGANGVIIKAPKGGPTTISRDGGTTWAPYKVPPPGLKLGTGTIDGRKVNPKTNVLR